MKQGKTTESQVKGEIHEQMTNIKKHRSPEFPEIGNVGVPEFPVISFRVGEAGSEGFAWCAVTEGREEVVRSSDE